MYIQSHGKGSIFHFYFNSKISQKIMEELSEMNLSNDTIPHHTSITSTLIDNNSKGFDYND